MNPFCFIFKPAFNIFVLFLLKSWWFILDFNLLQIFLNDIAAYIKFYLWITVRWLYLNSFIKILVMFGILSMNRVKIYVAINLLVLHRLIPSMTNRYSCYSRSNIFSFTLNYKVFMQNFKILMEKRSFYSSQND